MKNANLDKLDSLIDTALRLQDEHRTASAPLGHPSAAARNIAKPLVETADFWNAVKRVGKFEFSQECSFSQSSEVGEKFREIRANLQTLQTDKGIKVIVFSSSHHNEGKTHTAVNAARFMAHSKGRKTLLIDCDLRRPQIKNHITAQCDYYLEDILAGKCKITDAVVHSEEDNLSLLLTRRGQSNATEMLEAPAMVKLLATLRQAFDFVIIDTSPILSTTDPMILGAMSDGIILVVKTGFTQRESVEQAISLMYQSNAKVLGVVLSQMKNYIPKYLYRYHYFSDAYSDYYAPEAKVKKPRAAKTKVEEHAKNSQPASAPPEN
jgi:receptor protein-tyrosine kinase